MPDSTADATDLLALPSGDFSPLAARLRTLEQSVKCTLSGVNFHLHYPAFRQGSPTIAELVQVIVDFLTAFALPRSQIDAVRQSYGNVPADVYERSTHRLRREASSLFQKAQKATGRHGESGELLLYLFCEWVLGAPQILAKMSLKTDAQMPVHGADGIHIRYDDTNEELLIYWGEAKLYANVQDAISAAAKSIETSLLPSEIDYEFSLVSRHIDLSGLSTAGKVAMLQFLDPFDECYNKRRDIVTCMIGYDCEAYGSVAKLLPQAREAKFIELVRTQLHSLAPVVSSAFSKAGIIDHEVQIFFLPLPSVQVLRQLFLDEIGWK